jgi:hypothetical protein
MAITTLTVHRDWSERHYYLVHAHRGQCVMMCPDCKGTGQHPAGTQCALCYGHGHDRSGIGWPSQPEPEPGGSPTFMPPSEP